MNEFDLTPTVGLFNKSVPSMISALILVYLAKVISLTLSLT